VPACDDPGSFGCRPVYLRALSCDSARAPRVTTGAPSPVTTKPTHDCMKRLLDCLFMVQPPKSLRSGVGRSGRLTAEPGSRMSQAIRRSIEILLPRGSQGHISRVVARITFCGDDRLEMISDLTALLKQCLCQKTQHPRHRGHRASERRAPGAGFARGVAWYDACLACKHRWLACELQSRRMIMLPGAHAWGTSSVRRWFAAGRGNEAPAPDGDVI
jgi:hypothetical protein